MTGALTGTRLLVTGINYSPEPTGIAPYTAGMVDGLAGQGVLARVLTTFPHYPQWRTLPGWDGRSQRERSGSAEVTRFRPRLPSRPGLVPRALFELHFGLRSVTAAWRRPDVVVTVSPALFASAWSVLRARLSRVPSVVWVQDIYSLGVQQTGHGGPAARLLAAVEGGVLRRADRVVVIHERFARFLEDHLSVPADKVAVVRNWSHVSEPVDVDRPAVRARRGWAEDDVVVLHAGNMGAKQGLENVVEASRVAASRGSRVRFVLMGDGNQRAELEAMGGNPRLQIIDPVPGEEFTATLASADVLLVNERPGLTEMSVPSKLTSYFSTGLPVLAATDVSSTTAEELALAGAGVRVDAAAPQALLEAAESLAADPERARRLGQAGVVFRTQVLSVEAAVAGFAEVLIALRR